MNNQFYDKEDAKKALNDAIEESKTFLGNEDPAVQHLNSLNARGHTQIWRIGPLNSDGEIEEEFAFHMQGVISKLNLRPGEVDRLPVAKALSTSQQVSLVGIGSPLFKEGLGRLKDAHALFVRHFPVESMTNWVASDGAEPVLHASNRFFTSLEDDPTAVHIPFEKGVDPLNKLQRFVGDQLVHTSANVVKYYKRTCDSTTMEYKVEVVLPSHFKVGDIVEIDASIIAFKTSGRKTQIKMHCNLNGMTLLNTTYSSRAEEAKRNHPTSSIVSTAKLLRKNPYERKDGPAKKKFGGAKPADGAGHSSNVIQT
ncbi:hypothetical protein B0H13DRAFT_1874818 [Mycena leptocephala]|nr:hypothetical protein B0H13DRAFT_1874818 [Mycena leptocephala]